MSSKSKEQRMAERVAKQAAKLAAAQQTTEGATPAATEPKAPRVVKLRARNGAVAIFRHLDAWTKTVTAGGNESADNGDAAATKLRGLTLDEAFDVVARELKADVGALRTRYAGLNAGQQRMNLGNRLRGEFARRARAAAAKAG